jgi:5'-nucleotidase
MMAHILLTNDDGIHGQGILAAYKSVSPLGKVTVIAPSVQKSGVGRGISILEPIRVSKLKLSKFHAYSIDGTPTDAVIVGIYAIMKRRPDLFLSGFNIGENLSTESVTTSGTVGSALEAASHGIPAIAASVQVAEEGEKFDEWVEPRDLEIPIRFVRRVASKIISGGLPQGVDLLNINFPYHTTSSTPVEITRLARKVYRTTVRERRDPRGRLYYWIDGKLRREAEKGTDVHAVLKEGKISVSPISLDSTASVDKEEIEKLL